MIIDFPGKEEDEEQTLEEIHEEILGGLEAVLNATGDELDYFIGIFGAKSGGYCMFQWPKEPENILSVVGALELSKENLLSYMYQVEDDDILEE